MLVPRLRWLRSDTFLLGALLVATLGVRLWTLRTPDLGGDAAFKWFFLRSWAAENPWVFDHHTARFSINVPAWLALRLFGSHPNVMYVAPLAAALAQVPLLYGVGRALGLRWAGLLACLLLLVFEPMADAASQFLPGIFQATYLLGALHAVVRFDCERRRRWAIAAGIWLFAAYLAMVTTVYVLPGFVLALWLPRRRSGDVAWALGAFAVLWAVETAGYALWSKYPFGQFQLILSTHTDVKPITFWGLFERYAALPPDWQLVLALWIVSAATLLPLRHRTRPAAWALWLFPASLLLGMTFGVKHLDPLIPATDFSVRYCDMLMPMIALCLATAACTALQPLARRSAPGRAGVLLTAASLAGIAGVALAAARLYQLPSGHALVINQDQWQTLNDAYARGLPIVAGNRDNHFQMKALVCIQWAYLRDELIRVDGTLVVRRQGKTRAGARSHRYLTRDDQRPEAVAQAIRRHRCMLAATRVQNEPKLELRVYDGPECPR